ncbi:nucleotide disphospho-sugar-binding domain-containing protein [Dactylosporangium sp. CA-092794]|uniref:nucleotide disphospho-sugar-binding domain-containing protein n=1 Tax=Dactylosporangium sp. CA-092794 TaxID=3239929 RepID=UPI003D8F3F3A
MRVLLTTWAWPSHLYPMVPLGWALQAAGHEVRVAVAPGLTETADAAGLCAVPLAEEPDLTATGAVAGLRSWHVQPRWTCDWHGRPHLLTSEQREMYEALGEKQIRTAEAMVDGLVGYARSWGPDLIVHDAITFAAQVAGAVTDVPTVGTLWGNIAVPRHERNLFTGEPVEGYRRLFERFGVPPRPDPVAWIDPCPPRMRLPSAEPRLDCRYVPYNGRGGVPPWLRDPPEATGLPRICVTWGITAGRTKASAVPDVFDDVVAAVAALARDIEIEVVFAVAPAQLDRLGALPPRTRVASSLPLHLLLPSCSAIVHQGGGGTTMTALASGTPQLVISPRPEQMMTGDRLEQLGAGRHLVRIELAGEPRTAAETIRAALFDLLNRPSYRENAERLRADILDLPTPADLVPELVKVAGRAPSGVAR